MIIRQVGLGWKFCLVYAFVATKKPDLTQTFVTPRYAVLSFNSEFSLSSAHNPHSAKAMIGFTPIVEQNYELYNSVSACWLKRKYLLFFSFLLNIIDNFNNTKMLAIGLEKASHKEVWSLPTTNCTCDAHCFCSDAT